MGSKPKYIREGGSIPAMAMFKKILGIDTTVFAFGLDDDFVHAPNERCALKRTAMSIAARRCLVQVELHRRGEQKHVARPRYGRLHMTLVCRTRHSFWIKGREAYIKLLHALGGARAATAADAAKASRDEL